MGRLFALFARPGDLLQALRGTDHSLPSTVISSGERWAVSLDLFGEESNAQNLLLEQQQLYQWSEIRFEELANDQRRAVPWWHVVGGCWRPFDPVRRARESPWLASESTGQVRRYRPADGNPGMAMHAVLLPKPGASGALVQALASVRAHGILARPLSVPVKGARAAWDCLWVVEGMPPLEVRNCADRVFWGLPLQESAQANFYQEFPFELELEEQLVADMVYASIDGVKAKSIVLLGPHEVLSVEVPKGTPLLADLLDVAGIEPCPGVTLVPVAAAERKLDVLVQLSFARTDPRATRLARRKEILAEMEAWDRSMQYLEREIERLGRGADQGYEPPPEPLLLLFERRDAGVPDALRTILATWTTEEMRSLWYQRIDASGLPQELRWSHLSYVHVLTTAAAIGIDTSVDPREGGLRLRTVAADAWAFDQLPEWLLGQEPLYLFAPRGRYLTLYPELRPGDQATPMLGRALLAGTELASEQACILLLSGPEERPWPLVLRRDCFCQLVDDAIDWQLRVPIAPVVLKHAPGETAQGASDTLIAGFDIAFSKAHVTAIVARLEKERQQFDALVAELRDKRERQEEAIQRIDNRLRRLDAELDRTRDSLTTVTQQGYNALGAITKVGSLLDSVVAARRQISGALEEIKGLEASAREMERRTTEISQDIRDFEDEIGRRR
jgi:archaellum component FlaC